MSLKNRLLNKNVKVKEEMTATTAVSTSYNLDILNYFENNPDISAVLIYGPHSIYVEKDGSLEESDLSLKDLDTLLSSIEKIANQYDRIINSQNPSYNITLSNGIRINAIVPPMIKEGAYLSLRRQPKCVRNFDGIIEDKVVSNEILLFLKECLNNNLNIFVTGEAQVNKTNVLNFLANKISQKENIITVESVPQLKLKRDCVLKLIKNKGNFQKTIKKAINLGHNRIVVSDANVSELVSLFEYINSGYNGFLTSFSSKSYEEMIFSLQNLIMLSFPNLIEQNANALISSSIDVIVYVSKTSDGCCRITHISEIIKNKTGIKLQDIFVWKESKSKTNKFNGTHFSTGLKSKYFADNKFSSIGLLEEYFNKEYKHNYIGKSSGKMAEKQSQSKKEDSSLQTRMNKYKSLKEKIKSQST